MDGSFCSNQLGKHVTGDALFISNFIISNEVGYFDTAAEQKPMLHLWSLAVEEQFYIFWPLLLFILWGLRVNLLLVCFVVIFLSFIANVNFVSRYPIEVYFWLFHVSGNLLLVLFWLGSL